MDYSVENNKERDFLKKDFSVINTLLGRIRNSLVSEEKVFVDDLELAGILDYDPKKTFVYITLFHPGLSPIRWGSCRATLEQTINRDIEKIKG